VGAAVTTYLVPQPKSALTRELAASDRVTLTPAWYTDPLPCARCGVELAKGPSREERPNQPYSLTDFFCDEPGQFWQERRILVCGTCALDVGYASERLARKRGAKRGGLKTWGNTKRGKR
jgi:hypothetical protein